MLPSMAQYPHPTPTKCIWEVFNTGPTTALCSWALHLCTRKPCHLTPPFPEAKKLQSYRHQVGSSISQTLNVMEMEREREEGEREREREEGEREEEEREEGENPRTSSARVLPPTPTTDTGVTAAGFHQGLLRFLC